MTDTDMAKSPGDDSRPTKPRSRSQAKGRAAKAKGGASARQTQSGKSKNALALVREQQKQLKAILAKRGKGDIRSVVKELVPLWAIHTVLEEEILEPAAEKSKVDPKRLAVARVRGDIAKILVKELLHGGEDDDMAAAQFEVLADELESLFADVARPKTGLLALLTAGGADQTMLADQMKTATEALEGSGEMALERLAPRSLAIMAGSRNGTERTTMARQSRNMPERDDQGRFISDDDDDRGGRRYSQRGRGYDDRGYGDRGYGDYGGDYGNERGRQSSQDDRYGSGSPRYEDDRRSSRSRYENDDYDDRRSSGRGRGQGGWFGDPEGHSEASRRGWEERQGGYRSRSGRYDDDDDRRSSSGGRYDDERGSGRGHGGWYGDSEGHSEASRRGWEERGRSSSRSSRYDDDDDRRGSRSAR